MNFKNVYIADTNCVTPIGFDVESNIENITKGISGITLQDNPEMMDAAFYAGVVDNQLLNDSFSKSGTADKYSRLEKMMLLALKPVINQSGIEINEHTGLVISTTKGNVALLKNKDAPSGAYLHNLAATIACYFGFVTEPIVVSNACVSGIMAISVAKRMIVAGIYDNVFIVSGDEVSEFVLSGFNSFQAMSKTPCRPYSPNRDGITIGEAAAAVLVTADIKNAKARIAGDGSINDANHISGPSRTGEGLVKSIESALREADIEPAQIDYISAHGTATLYNDEMETVAFNRLGLQSVPINSFKGYYGHTLGSSGLLETVIGLESMQKNKLYKSLGYENDGDAAQINVITENIDKEVNYFLKTASGFGGTNTAVVFEKIK